MITQSTHYYAEIVITDGKELEHQLDKAVEEAIQEAPTNPGCGVLVTRRDRRTFTIELTNDVPHGTITERELSNPVPTRIS
ncbi:hypothetical protein [[Arthrobacter] sp. ATCC 21022]|uniref:hypothetical protein n=1 Tax=[Arthrobacter] sp. ATCC 21022 TaxID=1771959 RepID=UPI000A4A26FE